MHDDRTSLSGTICDYAILKISDIVLFFASDYFNFQKDTQEKINVPVSTPGGSELNLG